MNKIKGDNIDISGNNAKLNKQVGDNIHGKIKGDSNMLQIASAKNVYVTNNYYSNDEVSKALIKVLEGVIIRQSQTIDRQAESLGEIFKMLKQITFTDKILIDK